MVKRALDPGDAADLRHLHVIRSIHALVVTEAEIAEASTIFAAALDTVTVG